MNKFNDLEFQKKRFRNFLKDFSEEEKERILKAYKLSDRYHKGQVRDEGPPYIIHPLRIASCLMEDLGIKDGDVICAALLHDTIEDVTIEQRDSTEVSHVLGKVQIVPDGVECLNYAFDITPFRLVTGIITEDGVYSPEELLKKYK